MDAGIPGLTHRERRVDAGIPGFTHRERRVDAGRERQVDNFAKISPREGVGVGTVLHAVMVAVTPTRCSQQVSGRINIRVGWWTLPICPCASYFIGSRSNNQSDQETIARDRTGREEGLEKERLDKEDVT